MSTTHLTRPTTDPVRSRRSPCTAWLASVAGMLGLVALASSCAGTSPQAADRGEVASLSSAPGVVTPSTGHVGPAGTAAGGTLPGEVPSTDPDEAMLQFSQCMRDHGVDMVDAGPSAGESGSVSNSTPLVASAAVDVDRATAECQRFLEHAQRTIQADPAAQAEMERALLAYSQCMRDHGIDMPDPQFGPGGEAVVKITGSTPGAGSGPATPLAGPAFDAANRACAALMPGEPSQPERSSPAETAATTATPRS